MWDDDDHGLDAGGDAFSDAIGNSRRRGGDQRQVDRFRHVSQRAAAPHSQHAVPPWLDRVDRAAERRADQIPEQGASDAARPFTGSDNGDATGLKQSPQGHRAAAQDVGRGVKKPGHARRNLASRVVARPSAIGGNEATERASVERVAVFINHFGFRHHGGMRIGELQTLRSSPSADENRAIS